MVFCFEVLFFLLMILLLFFNLGLDIGLELFLFDNFMIFFYIKDIYKNTDVNYFFNVLM